MNFFLVKAVASTALAVLSLNGPSQALTRRFAAWPSWQLTAVFIASRITLAAVVFGLAGFDPPGDTVVFYRPFAEAALHGARDPLSPYSPGFDYLLAALLWAFGSARAFVFAMVAAEAGAFAVTLVTLRRSAENLAPPIAMLWLVSPISVFAVALGGHDDALILLGSAIALWALATERAAFGGMVMAATTLASKILGVFSGLPLLAASWRRFALAALVGGVALGVAGLWLTHAGVSLGRFHEEMTFATSGTVWSWPAIFRGEAPAPHLWQFVVCALAMIGAAGYLMARPVERPVDQALRLVGTIGCVFLALVPQSYGSYLVMFLTGVLFLLYQTRRTTRIWLTLLFLPAVTFESSLWYQVQASEAGRALLVRLAMLGVDACLLSGYAALAWCGLTLGNGRMPRRADVAA